MGISISRLDIGRLLKRSRRSHRLIVFADRLLMGHMRNA
jgi:hypothetical protein